MPQEYLIIGFENRSHSVFDYPGFPQPLHAYTGRETGGNPRRLAESSSASNEIVEHLTSPIPRTESLNDQAIFLKLDQFIEDLTDGLCSRLDPSYGPFVESVLSSTSKNVISEGEVKAWADELSRKLQSFSDLPDASQ